MHSIFIQFAVGTMTSPRLTIPNNEPLQNYCDQVLHSEPVEVQEDSDTFAELQRIIGTPDLQVLDTWPEEDNTDLSVSPSHADSHSTPSIHPRIPASDLQHHDVIDNLSFK